MCAKLWVFGSILTNRFNNESDVDLCVDFDKRGQAEIPVHLLNWSKWNVKILGV